MIIIWKKVYWKTHLILKAWKIWIFQYLRCDFFQRCRGTKSLADDSLAFAQSLPRGRPQWWSSECAKTTNWRWLNSTNEMFQLILKIHVVFYLKCKSFTFPHTEGMRESLKTKLWVPYIYISYKYIISIYIYVCVCYLCLSYTIPNLHRNLPFLCRRQIWRNLVSHPGSKDYLPSSRHEIQHRTTHLWAQSMWSWRRHSSYP